MVNEVAELTRALANSEPWTKQGYGGFSGTGGGILSKSFFALVKLILQADDPPSVLKPATPQDSAGPKSAAFSM